MDNQCMSTHIIRTIIVELVMEHGQQCQWDISHVSKDKDLLQTKLQ